VLLPLLVTESAKNLAMNFEPLLKTCSAISLDDLRQKKALRMSLPGRVLLTSGDMEGTWEADLVSVAFEEKIVCVQLLRPGSQEVPAEVRLGLAEGQKWQIQSSSSGDFRTGMLVDIFDATPCVPASVELDEQSQSMLLRSSDTDIDTGSLTYDGMGGFAPAECPRELDSIDIAFTIWYCPGSSGSCKALEQGEDATALVCEFGPESLKKGIKNMIPGEARRFWVSADVTDRRFGRPAPDRFLPAGEVVVDIEVRSIGREGVFEFQSSPETLELVRQRDESLPVITKRALGVGIQILPWAWLLSQYEEKNAGPTREENMYRLQGGPAADP